MRIIGEHIGRLVHLNVQIIVSLSLRSQKFLVCTFSIGCLACTPLNINRFTRNLHLVVFRVSVVVFGWYFVVEVSFFKIIISSFLLLCLLFFLQTLFLLAGFGFGNFSLVVYLVWIVMNRNWKTKDSGNHCLKIDYSNKSEV